jgi:hypothetical protein
MKRCLLPITISLLVVSCATREAATTTHPVLVWHGETTTWDPHLGPNGGYHFSSGVTAQYDPALGAHGGFRFNNGVTAEYDPSLGPHGGYRYSTGRVTHHVPSQHGGHQTVQ